MKVLFLYPYLLYPGVAHGGGRLLVPLLERLRKHAEITLVCGYRPQEQQFLESARELVAHLHAVPRPFKVDKTVPLRAAELARTVTKELLTDAPRFVTKLDRQVFHRAVAEVRAHRRFDLVQVELAGFAQYIEALRDLPSILVDHEAGSASSQTPDTDRRVLSYVKRIYPLFTQLCALSPEDAASLEAILPGREVLVRAPGVTLPGIPATPSPGDPGRILFFGSVDHLPNREALEWFAENVWPRIHQDVPGARLIVAGGRLPLMLGAKLKRAGVEVLGFVENLGAELERAAVVVAPIRSGRGVRIKNIETLAAARPLVSTRLGAQGLRLVDGETALLADEADTFAAAVTRLLRNPADAVALGVRGRRHVEHNYSHDRAAEFNLELWTKMVRSPTESIRVGMETH